MIFGFNTDVRYGDTLFHLQSEPRYSEKVLETQVFVGGRCIGKRATSYAARMSEPGFFEEHLQEMLKGQHRQLVDAARNGRLYELLHEGEKLPSTLLACLNPGSVYSNGALRMRFELTESGTPVAGACVTSRLRGPGLQPSYAQATTDRQGHANLEIETNENQLHEAAVVVQTMLEGKNISKKFRFKRL